MDELTISTDLADVDLDGVRGFLNRDAYCCPGIGRDRVERAVRHSLCFSSPWGGAQVGFARVVSDAHGLYAKHGFAPITRPERFMERYRPDAYRR